MAMIAQMGCGIVFGSIFVALAAAAVIWLFLGSGAVDWWYRWFGTPVYRANLRVLELTSGRPAQALALCAVAYGLVFQVVRYVPMRSSRTAMANTSTAKASR